MSKIKVGLPSEKWDEIIEDRSAALKARASEEWDEATGEMSEVKEARSPEDWEYYNQPGMREKDDQAPELHDIGWALQQLYRGQYVCREGWNGKNMWLGYQHPEPRSDMTAPYVYMKTADNLYVPWLCSQTDLLATDWERVDPEK